MGGRDPATCDDEVSKLVSETNGSKHALEMTCGTPSAVNELLGP